MRHIKMMSLAVPAVLALLAIAGATTASATRLCSTNTSPCTSAYPAGTTFHTDLVPGTYFVWTMSGSPLGTNPTLTCSQSTWNITATNAGGGAGVSVLIRLTAWSSTSCTSANPSGCEASWTTGGFANANGQVAWTSGVNGTVTFTPPTLTYSCPYLGANISCTYGGSGTIDGTLTGGAMASIDFVSQSFAPTGGFGCSTAAQWNGRITVTRTLFVTDS